MDMQMGCWDTCQSWKRSCLELAGRFSEVFCDLVVVHKRVLPMALESLSAAVYTICQK